MMEESPAKPQDQTEIKDHSGSDDGEINLLVYLRIIWKRRKLISRMVFTITILTIILSLFMTDVYQARAVITPITSKDSSGMGITSLLSQQLGGLPGMIMPGQSNAEEIVNLLKSNILREKVITRYDLLPVIFYDDWNAEKKIWKSQESGFSLNPLTWFSRIRGFVTPTASADLNKKQPGIPDVRDGIRELYDRIGTNYNVKENAITIVANFHDPVIAAKFIENFLTTLTDHMSSEARRVALTNMKYLQSQLHATTDPFIKQRIFNLIAQQLENSMMAEVKENFAFKITDPPMVPDKRNKPRRIQMAGIALVVSVFLGLFAALFFEYLERQNIKINTDASFIKLLTDKWKKEK